MPSSGYQALQGSSDLTTLTCQNNISQVGCHYVGSVRLAPASGQERRLQGQRISLLNPAFRSERHPITEKAGVTTIRPLGPRPEPGQVCANLSQELSPVNHIEGIGKLDFEQDFASFTCVAEKPLTHSMHHSLRAYRRNNPKVAAGRAAPERLPSRLSTNTCLRACAAPRRQQPPGLGRAKRRAPAKSGATSGGTCQQRGSVGEVDGYLTAMRCAQSLPEVVASKPSQPRCATARSCAQLAQLAPRKAGGLRGCQGGPGRRSVRVLGTEQCHGSSVQHDKLGAISAQSMRPAKPRSQGW